MPAVVVLKAEVLIRDAPGEEMVRDAEDRMGHGHDGFPVSPVAGDATVSGAQDTVLLADGPPGPFG
jgi:hypothetical protein